VRWKILVEALCSAAEWWNAIYIYIYISLDRYHQSLPNVLVKLYTHMHACTQIHTLLPDTY
jgi:hypothetical protein